jgi:F0F1-type ATP synthase membrane subunit b/b'
MMLLMGQTVNLLPDKTVIWQLIIFLFVAAVLSFLVFRPTMKILERRRSETLGLEKKIGQVDQEAEVMEQKYAEKIAEARAEGSAAERELVNLGEEEARKIVAAAREKEKTEIGKVRDEVASDSSASRRELSRSVDEFSKMIVSKILGKNA